MSSDVLGVSPDISGVDRFDGIKLDWLAGAELDLECIAGEWIVRQ